MLKIYLEENKDTIMLNDFYFDKYTSANLDYEVSKRIVEKIDAVSLTKELMVISKFTGGEVDVLKLSTGCKTVLNIIHNPNKIFTVAECGKNALTEIYKLTAGNIFTRCLIIPSAIDFDCDIEIIKGNSIYMFNKLSDLRYWYAESGVKE